MSRRPSFAAALGLVAATLASPALAADHDLDVAIEPSAVTWRDPVHLTVTDTRATACTSTAFTLTGRTDTVVPGVGRRVDLTLVESCPILAPATIKTIEVSTDLGRLEPGPTIVRVTDQSSGRQNELAFTVHDPGRELLTLPDVVTNAAAASLHLRALVGYYVVNVTPPSTVTVHDHVIDVEIRTIFPPPPISLLPPPVLNVVDFDVPLPVLAAGDYEIRVLDESQSAAGTLDRATLHVWRAAGCLPSATRLCLQDGRFGVEGNWHAFDRTSGAAHALPLDHDGSGVLWFFAPENPEITLKVIDGCALTGTWWVFLAASTNVEYSIVVTDTSTGHLKGYGNSLGVFPPLVTDTSAFPCVQPPI